MNGLVYFVSWLTPSGDRYMRACADGEETARTFDAVIREWVRGAPIRQIRVENPWGTDVTSAFL